MAQRNSGQLASCNRRSQEVARGKTQNRDPINDQDHLISKPATIPLRPRSRALIPRKYGPPCGIYAGRSRSRGNLTLHTGTDIRCPLLDVKYVAICQRPVSCACASLLEYLVPPTLDHFKFFSNQASKKNTTKMLLNSLHR